MALLPLTLLHGDNSALIALEEASVNILDFKGSISNTNVPKISWKTCINFLSPQHRTYWNLPCDMYSYLQNHPWVSEIIAQEQRTN